ncbi:MAG TPA: hypothetical protein VNT01_10050 [Symbiobacteriaceae bacterium]|nr:hypothetical protein [Symbiobacteriaceae bacterium]
MPTKLPTIACTTVELAFLASLLGADSLIGVPDPFAGWSGDAVEEAWEEVRRALAERRLVTLQSDGAVSIETSVAELVGTCGFAEATFMLTYTAADGTAAGHHFHVIRHSAVELVLSHETVLTCQLSGVDTATVLDRVTEIFRLGDQGAPCVPNGRLTEASLRAARLLAEESGPAAAGELLETVGLCRETAAALAGSLARPLGSGALVAIASDQSDAGVDGLALLEGENGLWLLRNVHEGNARWVDVVPCTAEGLRYFIRSIMNRALPGKLI